MHKSNPPMTDKINPREATTGPKRRTNVWPWLLTSTIARYLFMFGFQQNIPYRRSQLLYGHSFRLTEICCILKNFFGLLPNIPLILAPFGFARYRVIFRTFD